jgi:hypothetical protein
MGGCQSTDTATFTIKESTTNRTVEVSVTLPQISNGSSTSDVQSTLKEHLFGNISSFYNVETDKYEIKVLLNKPGKYGLTYMDIGCYKNRLTPLSPDPVHDTTSGQYFDVTLTGGGGGAVSGESKTFKAPLAYDGHVIKIGEGNADKNGDNSKFSTESGRSAPAIPVGAQLTNKTPAKETIPDFTANGGVYNPTSIGTTTNGKATLTLNISKNTEGKLKFINCFPAGTPVRTPTGDKPIEIIHEGDLVTVADGRHVPVKLAHRSLVQKANRSNAPYFIPANSLGPNLPRNDLIMSPNHMLHIGNDQWLPAWKCKYRSSQVRQIRIGETFMYYNLGLPNYFTDNLVVNGVEVESMRTRNLVLDKATKAFRRQQESKVK